VKQKLLDEEENAKGGAAATDRSWTRCRITHHPPIRIIVVDIGSVTLPSRSHEWEASVTAVDSLMMDAKQAIMDEHHRRFQTLYQEGRWEEALQQIHITLSCATDLLNESLRVLDEALDGTTPTPLTVPLPLPQPRSE
jgi:hypothetical protein